MVVSYGILEALERLETEHGVLVSEGGGLSSEAATYADYRRVLSRRMACLRSQLKLVNSRSGKGSQRSFEKKEVERLESGEEVMLAMLPAERAWARSQELKLSRNLDEAEDRRVRARLKKAAGHAAQLVELCVADADEGTVREARGWSLYLRGLANEKKGELGGAVEDLRAAYELYGSARSAQVVLGSLKRCEYALTGRVSVVETHRETPDEDESAVEWCGRKLRAAPPALARRLSELSETDEDAMNALDDLLREAERGTFEDQAYVIAKIKYRKLCVIKDRISAAIARTETSWKQATLRQTARLLRSADEATEPTGAETLAQLYDNVCQLFVEMRELPGVDDGEDDSLGEFLDAELAKYRASKCYFLAETFFDRRDYAKARALFKHAEILADRAAMEADASGQPTQPLSDLADGARGGAVRCKLAKHRRDAASDAAPLPASTDSIKLADIPPKARPLPAKPFVFDVAHEALAFPLDDLHAKAHPDTAGRGLFGWFRRRRQAAGE